MKEESIQFSIMIKCQNKVLIVFVYQLYWLFFKMGKKYYCQEFLEECKYIVKEKEVTRHITKDLDISSLINVQKSLTSRNILCSVNFSLL